MVAYRNRTNDGGGKAKNSFLKHRWMKLAASAQIIILNNFVKGQGLIIDMHAGDGSGVEEPQLVLPFSEQDFQEYMRSDPSPAIADRLAQICTPRADLILCERDSAARARLERAFPQHTQLRIFPNHKKLLQIDLVQYRWIFVFNDPCGPRDQGIPVLQYLDQHPKADFLLVVNEGAIGRVDGLGAEEQPTDTPQIRGARKKKAVYTWEKDPKEWLLRLHRHLIWGSKQTINNPAFRGRVFVVSNHLADRFYRPSWGYVVKGTHRA